MVEIEVFLQTLTELYAKIFKQKEPVALLCQSIETLILLLEDGESRDEVLFQFADREIQMYNYLTNELITELQKEAADRRTSGVISGMDGNRKTQAIVVQTIPKDLNRRINIPDFETVLVSPNIAAALPFERGADQRDVTPYIDEYTAENIIPSVPSYSEAVMEQRNLISNIEQQITPINDDQILSISAMRSSRKQTSEMQQFTSLVDLEGTPAQVPLPIEAAQILIPDLDSQDKDHDNFLPENTSKIETIMEQRNLISDPELPAQSISEKILLVGDTPSNLLLKTSENLSQLKSYRTEISHKQQDHLEQGVPVPEIPPDDPLMEEFRELFEKRRREKAAIDYAARSTNRNVRSAENLLKYRDTTRNIAKLKIIPDAAHTLRIIPVFSKTSGSDTSSKIQKILIRDSHQECHQGPLTDQVLQMEFSNLIINRPQSTPEKTFQELDLSYGAKRKAKKWTSALPVLEEDQADAQRLTDDVEKQIEITIAPKSTELQDIPLQVPSEITKSKNFPLKQILPIRESPLPVLPPVDMFIRDRIAETSERITREEIAPQTINLDYVTPALAKPKKRSRLPLEEISPKTKRHCLTDNVVLQQHFQSWKSAVKLNAASTDTHKVNFPIDLVNTLEFGKPIQQVLEEVVANDENSLRLFPLSTSTRKEAAKRIRILHELKTQNILDFVTQDGEVTGIFIKE